MRKFYSKAFPKLVNTEPADPTVTMFKGDADDILYFRCPRCKSIKRYTSPNCNCVLIA